jgi:NitT/TauT family transport system substrate-binding protein
MLVLWGPEGVVLRTCGVAIALLLVGLVTNTGYAARGWAPGAAGAREASVLAQRPAPLAPPVTVKAASLLGLTDAGLFIGIDRGYFTEEGVEIDSVRVDGAAQAMPFVATGQLDVAGVTPASGFFNAVQRGLQLRIAADKGRVTPGYSQNSWMLREDVAAGGGVRDWADLRGLTLGINVPGSGSSTDIMLDAALGLGGLTRSDVQIVELPYPDMNPAFANRRIDASLHTEPFASQGINLGVSRRWRPASDARAEQYTGVWLYSPQFSETEAANRFMVGYLRGVRDYNDAIVYGRGRAGVVDVLTRHTAVKDPAIYDQMAFAGIDPNGRVQPEVLQQDVEYYVSHGFMQQWMDVRQVIDGRYVDYALGRLGQYQPPTP